MKRQVPVNSVLRFMLAASLCMTGVGSVTLNAVAAPLPSYAEPSNETRIVGRIASFDGRYDLTVRDRNGYIDHVQLRRGTVITPTGLTLEPGMVVHVIGFNDGDYFVANEIDTPYKMVTGTPYFGNQIWSSYGPAVPFGFYNSSSTWRTVIAPGFPGYYGTNIGPGYGPGPNYGPGIGPRPGYRPQPNNGNGLNGPHNRRYMQEHERALRQHDRDEHRGQDNRDRAQRREYRQDGGDRPQTGQFGLPSNGNPNNNDRLNGGQVGPPAPADGARPPGPSDGGGMRRRP